MRKAVALSVLLTLLLSVPVAAQQEQGDVELQFLGSVQSKVGKEGSTAGFIQTKLGYYFTDRLELGAFPSLTFSTGDTAIGIGVFGTYSFLTSNAMMVPYIGGQYYKTDLTVSIDRDRGWAGFTGGVKFYINRTTAFDVGGNYLFTLNEVGATLLLLQVGLSFTL